MKSRDLHYRRTVRLLGYDYAQPGAYFVTLCTHQMGCLFGTIVDGQVKLSQAGAIVQACWEEIPAHFGHVRLDAFVIMPNHLHGILSFVGARQGMPARETFSRPVSGSLASVIRLFKQAVTRRAAARDARAHRRVPLQHHRRPDVGARHGVPPQIWQRSYYEHIIRDEVELGRIREYITTNVLRWACDRYNPDLGVLVTNDGGNLVLWEDQT